MKKRLIAITAIMTLAIGCVTGCGASQEASAANDTAESTQEVTTEAVAETQKEENVQMANPWVTITEEEANANCARLFKAPEGASNQEWLKCESLGDPDKGIGPLIQLSFSLDGMELTARAQQGAAEDTDIAGNYVEWTVGPEEVTLANWGGGFMTGKTYRSVNESGYVDMITWYDIETGVSYSLSAAAKDLEGFDIQAVAEQMYAEENVTYEAVADDFLQKQAGKTSFASYDDAIAALQKGQGYAYVKLTGSEDDVLLVSDLVFEADHSTCQASVYSKQDGKVAFLSLVTSAGSSYPLRADDGVLYAGSNHSYETYFLSKEYGSLMMKDMISDGVDTGSNEFSGFTREKNTFDDFSDFTGGQEEFDKLMAAREEKPIVEFTVVE